MPTTWHWSHALLNTALLCAVLLRRPAATAVDRYRLPPGPQQQTRCAARCCSDRQTGQTDGRTPHLYMLCVQVAAPNYCD